MASWREEWRTLFAMSRTMPAVLRAQWDMRKARRLQQAGRHLEAFRLALPACGVLSQLAHTGHPAASSIIAFDAVLLDELATQACRPDAAREEMECALRVCEGIAGSCSKLEPKLREYIAWYRRRLSEQPGPVVQ